VEYRSVERIIKQWNVCCAAANSMLPARELAFTEAKACNMYVLASQSSPVHQTRSPPDDKYLFSCYQMHEVLAADRENCWKRNAYIKLEKSAEVQCTRI